mgnify:FL=1
MTNELLQYCQYYKGESQNPFHGKQKEESMLWECEHFWAHAGETNNVELLKDYLQNYIQAGLGIFEIEDTTPITLKALILQRYCQQYGYTPLQAIEPFKEFYKRMRK